MTREVLPLITLTDLISSGHLYDVDHEEGVLCLIFRQNSGAGVNAGVNVVILP